MKAIILAAGTGSRLYPLTRNTPKSLIEIGNGITLLENQLLNLTNSNITDVIVVIGYKAEQIESKIKNLSEYDFNISTIYNPFYDISNNLISLWFARNQMNEDDFIIINGDDIFTPEVITKLLKEGIYNDVVITIDRKSHYDEDDMKVIIKENKVIRIGKDIPIEEANGESIGIMKVSGKLRYLFIDKMDEMVRDKKNHNIFYLSIFQELIDMGIPCNYVEVAEKDWAELDFHPDLEIIRSKLDIFTKKWKF
ncbi:MAG: phosphocholine cytidylyltransferase family protein [Candidatus Odinarchaeia archaeon]